MTIVVVTECHQCLRYIDAYVRRVRTLRDAVQAGGGRVRIVAVNAGENTDHTLLRLAAAARDHGLALHIVPSVDASMVRLDDAYLFFVGVAQTWNTDTVLTLANQLDAHQTVDVLAPRPPGSEWDAEPGLVVTVAPPGTCFLMRASVLQVTDRPWRITVDPAVTVGTEIPEVAAEEMPTV